MSERVWAVVGYCIITMVCDRTCFLSFVCVRKRRPMRADDSNPTVNHKILNASYGLHSDDVVVASKAMQYAKSPYPVRDRYCTPTRLVLKINPIEYKIAENVIQYPNDAANDVPICVPSALTTRLLYEVHITNRYVNRINTETNRHFQTKTV